MHFQRERGRAKKLNRTDKLMHSFFLLFFISFNFVVFITLTMRARPDREKNLLASAWWALMHTLKYASINILLLYDFFVKVIFMCPYIHFIFILMTVEWSFLLLFSFVVFWLGNETMQANRFEMLNENRLQHRTIGCAHPAVHKNIKMNSRQQQKQGDRLIASRRKERIEIREEAEKNITSQSNFNYIENVRLTWACSVCNNVKNKPENTALACQFPSEKNRWTEGTDFFAFSCTFRRDENYEFHDLGTFWICRIHFDALYAQSTLAPDFFTNHRNYLST